MAPQGSCLSQAEARKLSEKKTGSDTQALRIQPEEQGIDRTASTVM